MTVIRLILQTRLEGFAADHNLEFRMYWKSSLQRWMFEFRNKEFNDGIIYQCSNRELCSLDPHKLADWIIEEVKRSNVIPFYRKVLNEWHE
jgi:hypothetical protein